MGRGLRSADAFARDDDGQTVVIVALMFTLMCGFAALAIDVGRFYAERRFLQDGVDAAALACARAYAQEGTSTAAWNAGNTILLDYNLRTSPTGLSYTVPASGSETYYDNVVSPGNLKSGILPQTSPYSGCRVAVYIDVPTFLVKLVNPGLSTIGLNARAYVIAKHGMVPVVVPKYSNGPGPGNGDETNFIHHTMQQGADYNCTTASDSGCTPATTSSKGREFVLFGASQKATNDNSFRGYIAPDIRDFQTTDGSGNLIHTAYNTVAANDSVNTLKDWEIHWIDEGYPGPDLCTVSTTSFLPCAEVAVINGASSGIFVPEITDKYRTGDALLAQLYDGTVKTIPNFTVAYAQMTVPSATSSLSSQTIAYTFSSQYRTSGAQVTTSFYPDDGTVTKGGSCTTCGDTLNPWHPSTTCGCSASSGSFSANPTPTNQSSYSQTWSGITTTSAPQGIYVVFLKGVSGAPYTGTEQLSVVTVNVSDQKKQFFIDTSDTYANVASAGANATYTIRVSQGNGQQAWNGGTDSITLAIDQCPKSGSTTLTCFFGTTSPGSQTSAQSADTTATLTVQTTGATSNTVYTGWIRASGTDASGKKVSRVLQIRTAINVVTGGTTDYVDVLGFAVFEVTTADSNDVRGRAVTGAYTNIDDPALALGRKYNLVPWETN